MMTMRLAFAPILLMLLVGALVGLVLRLRMQRGVSEPSCGHCGYCVRGLEHMTCPECGSDLRAVGILTPGTRPPMSRGMKLLAWTLLATLATLVLGGILQPLVGPQWLNTTYRRVIFLQTPYCNTILTASAAGKRLIFGYPRRDTKPAEMEALFLSANPGGPTLNVVMPSQQFTFTDAQGKTVRGTLVPAAIEKWLNSLGFTDPRVGELARDVAVALDEMSAPEGKGFTPFPQGASLAGRSNSGIAHPTFVVSVPKPNELTWIAWGILATLVWLAGAAVLFRRSRSMGVSPLSSEITGETPVLR